MASGKKKGASKRTLRDALEGQAKPRALVEFVPPTDEQRSRCEFVQGQVRDEGRWIGFAYRRRPLIESLAVTIGLTPADTAGLRYYRAAFDASETSETKSCLDVGVGGGGGNGTESRMLARCEANGGAKDRLARCEAAIGSVLPTMRAVVLFDRSFSQVAMDRYGTRKQEWLEDEVVNAGTGEVRKVFREKLVPRDHHRKLIAAEFKEGLSRLLDMLGGMQRVSGSSDKAAVVAFSRAVDPISSTVVNAMLAAELAGREIACIWLAKATLADMAREQAMHPDEMAEIGGVPVVVRDDWAWGWMLCEPASQEACAPPTQMA